MSHLKVWDGNIPYNTSRWDFADRLCARGFSDIVDVAVLNNRGCDDAWGLVTTPSERRAEQLMVRLDGSFFRELGVSATGEPFVFRPAKIQSREHTNLCAYLHVYKYCN